MVSDRPTPLSKVNYHCPNPDCKGSDTALPDAMAQAMSLKCPICATTLAAADESEDLPEPDSGRPKGIEELVESFPTLLAVPLAEFERESQPLLGLWAATNLMEITVKLCVMTGLAEHSELSEELQQALATQKLERPTMGNWMGMAEIVITRMPEKTKLTELVPTVEALSRLFGRAGASIDDGLLAMRNRLAHGGPCGRQEADRLWDLWKPRVREVVDRALRWLSKTRMVALDAAGELLLLRGEEAVPWEGMIPLVSTATPGTAWILVGEEAMPVGPLSTFDVEKRVPQIYVRRDELRLQYLLMDEVGGFSESGSEEVEWFRDRFQSRLEKKTHRQKAIQSFEPEIRRESAKRVGREEELSDLLWSIRNLSGESLWVSGPAGIGKSNLMASAMEALLDDPPPNTLVLPYRFRAGDDRCGRAPFLHYLVERLDEGDWLEEEQLEENQSGKKDRPPDPLSEARHMLSRLRKGTFALLLLDGLDEVVELDPQLVEEVVFGITNDRVSVAAAARPEHGIPESFKARGAIEPFPDGLPPLSENDVRASLLERASNVRKRLLAEDKELDGEVVNKFFARVAELSEGLPIYVNHLLGDLHSGKINPENTDSLPLGIHAYHDDLLRRLSVGDEREDLSIPTTATFVTLALAYEPLTAPELTALLRRMGQLEGDDSLVEQALGEIASLVRRISNPDGEEGYTIYHHSLRQHVLGSEELRQTVATIREALAQTSLNPLSDAAEAYLLRCGVRHMLAVGRRRDAIGTMGDFEHAMKRFRRLEESTRLMDEWYADWERLLDDGALEEDAAVWWDFARTNRHHFRKRGWEPWRVLFQAAMDHADDSPVTIGAEAFLANGKCNWRWVRWVNRPQGWTPSPQLAVMEHRSLLTFAKQLSDGRILSGSQCGTLQLWDASIGSSLALLEGHSDWVGGALELSDGRILSWSWDHALRIWDGATGESLTVLKGHSDEVCGAMELPDGRILSWSRGQNNDEAVPSSSNCPSGHGPLKSWEGEMRCWKCGWVAKVYNTLRIWEGQSGKSLASLEGHSATINGAETLPDGHILSWSNDGALRIWDGQSGDPIAALEGHTQSVGAEVLPDGRILSWSEDHTLRIWDGKSDESLVVLKGHSDAVIGAMELSDDRILSWSRDHTMRIWNGQSGKSLAVLKDHTGPVGGVMNLSDGRILSWSTDHTLRIWDGQSGKSLAVLKGHTDSVSGANLLPDGRILSWSYDHTLRIWHGVLGKPLAVLEGHFDDGIGAGIDGVEILEDGNILSFSGGDSTIRIWNAQFTGLFEAQEHSNFVQTKLLPGGRILSWSSDHTLRIWDGRSGESLAVLKGHTNGVYGALALSDDRILSWSGDHTLRIWDGQSGESLAVLKGHTDGVDGVQVLPGGHILSGGDNTLRLWDGQTGEPIAALQGHTGVVNDAQVLSDGRILSWARDTVRIWDDVSGEPLAVLEEDNKEFGGVRILDDDRIVSWSSDGTLRLWDCQSGKELAAIDDIGDEVDVVEIKSLSDSRVLICSRTQSPRVWNYNNGELIVMEEEEENPYYSNVVALSDDRVLAIGRYDALQLLDLDSNQLKISEELKRRLIELDGLDWLFGSCDTKSGELVDYTSKVHEEEEAYSYLEVVNALCGRVWVNARVVSRGCNPYGETNIVLEDEQFSLWWGDDLKLWDSHSGEVVEPTDNLKLQLAVRNEGKDMADEIADVRIVSWPEDQDSSFSNDHLCLWKSRDGGRLSILESPRDFIDAGPELRQAVAWDESSMARFVNQHRLQQTPVNDRQGNLLVSTVHNKVLILRLVEPEDEKDLYGDYYARKRKEIIARAGGWFSLADLVRLDASGSFFSEDELTELSDEVAESLSECEGSLDLSDLTILSDSAAESLSKKHQGLVLSEELDQKVTMLRGPITMKIAEQYLKGDDSVDLSQFSSIEEAAAEKLLAGHLGGWRLVLDGLTTLSDSVAEILSKHKGDLSLGGLKELSDAAAKSLAKKIAGELIFWSEELDEKVTMLRGPITMEIADQYLKGDGSVQLSHFSSIEEAAAEKLLTGHDLLGWPLELDGLTTLSDAAAESLSKYEGRLHLDGLTELSDAAAEILSKYKGDLSLYGLKKLSDAAAKSLAKKITGERIKELTDKDLMKR
jgi:WD40 repeat protein